jgi:hypothetical protein
MVFLTSWIVFAEIAPCEFFSHFFYLYKLNFILLYLNVKINSRLKMFANFSFKSMCIIVFEFVVQFSPLSCQN